MCGWLSPHNSKTKPVGCSDFGLWVSGALGPCRGLRGRGSLSLGLQLPTENHDASFARPCCADCEKEKNRKVNYTETPAPAAPGSRRRRSTSPGKSYRGAGRGAPRGRRGKRASVKTATGGPWRGLCAARRQQGSARISPGASSEIRGRQGPSGHDGTGHTRDSDFYLHYF